jgi:uncharacterized membrane protein
VPEGRIGSRDSPSIASDANARLGEGINIQYTLMVRIFRALLWVMVLENRTRSIVKTAVYRVIIIFLLAGITYYYTGNLGQTTNISILFNAGGTVIYYFWERLWDRISWGKSA